MSPSYALPICLHVQAEVPQDISRSSHIVETGSSTSSPCKLVSWGLSNSLTEELGGYSYGAILACSDGTLFGFHPCLTVSSHLKSPPKMCTEHSYSMPSSPFRLSKGSYPTSRSASPSSSSNHTQAPFNISSRSRVVSGVTTEAVEAPRNYVDFDEEPGKLKEMLKGRVPKDKNIPGTNHSEATSLSSPSSPTYSGSGAPTSHKGNPKSLLSATNSPSLIPTKVYSAPSSPQIKPTLNSDSSKSLSIRYHVIPSGANVNMPVTGLEIMKGNTTFVALRQSGDLCIYSVDDGACLGRIDVEEKHVSPPSGFKGVNASQSSWVWKSLQVVDLDESTLILVVATVDSHTTSPALDIQSSELTETCRVVLIQLRIDIMHDHFGTGMEKVGDWQVDGSSQGVGIYGDKRDSVVFFFINSLGQLVTRRLQLLPHNYVDLPPESQTDDMGQSNHTSLPLPNPFKVIKLRSIEHLPVIEPKENAGRIASSADEMILGELFPNQASILGNKVHCSTDVARALCWTNSELTAYEFSDHSLKMLFTSSFSGVFDVKWYDETCFAVVFKDHVDVYTCQIIDGNNNRQEDASFDIDSTHVQPKPLISLSFSPAQTADIVSETELLMTSIDDGCRQLKYFSGTASGTERILWRSHHQEASFIAPVTYLTCVLPLELEHIILGYSDGYLRQSSLRHMSGELPDTAFVKTSDAKLNGYIVGLYVASNGRTKERYIVGGADDGTIAFWALESLTLCARWTVFTTPLMKAIQFPDDKGPLRGCVLCISQDGTVAVIVIDGFQFLYLIPGSAFPLRRLCLGGDNLLLIYGSQIARLWDIRTKEFWRSMGIDKVEELLTQGGWVDQLLGSSECLSNSVLANINSKSASIDIASTLSFDLERFIMEAIVITKSISTSRDQTRAIFSTLDQLRSILSILLTWGLNDGVDSLCQEKLKILRSSASVGLFSPGTTTIYQNRQPLDAWRISEAVSASRCLAITVTLRALGLFEEYSDATSTVFTFYATALASAVGTGFKPPSLSYLAQRWFDSSNEVRQATRVLFDAAITRLDDEETVAFVARWQHGLPCLQPTIEKESASAALALFLCGYLAAEKYSLLPAGTLTDISKSIALYLHDEQSTHRVLAIDLCSKGFQIWQHYVDAMEMLRALFTIATSSRKESISTQNVGAQARLAVLSIASTNTPLFMTTLGLDILNPVSVEHRKSVMQIVAFLIRKRPLVLYPNLPRLMEAVVKSLDPNSTAYRDAVLDTATEILGHVVKTFPTVDFHMASQRLAVGTSEGAVVMYDLKTATRLYVLEGHKKRIAACSFSPDGRRLVSVSLEESVVLVWKVGSSFSSFFHPGAPPRQGHGGSQPYKTLSFNVGDEANMTIAATLEWVRFEWTADRSVKLKIRQSILTFST